jgi:DNA-binding response OmpR family regulator
VAEVVLVRWPQEAAKGRRLAAVGVPVLYLVEGDDAPPTATTCLEDWVRTPGDDRDLHARVAALERRAEAHHAPPRVDDEGRFHYQGRLLQLSPEEARLASVLTDHIDATVPDSDLAVAGASGQASQVFVRRHMMQLRTRLRNLDLQVKRVPREGYVLRRRR